MSKTTPKCLCSYELYEPSQRAAIAGKGEFNPESETHHFGFTVKMVNPGCTAEVQIEEVSGRVTRLTTKESSESDRQEIREAILEATDRFIKAYYL